MIKITFEASWLPSDYTLESKDEGEYDALSLLSQFTAEVKTYIKRNAPKD